MPGRRRSGLARDKRAYNWLNYNTHLTTTQIIQNYDATKSRYL